MIQFGSCTLKICFLIKTLDEIVAKITSQEIKNQFWYALMKTFYLNLLDALKQCLAINSDSDPES